MTRSLSILLILSSLSCQAAVRTASTPSQPDVQAQVDLSANGDTIVLPAGSATWNASINTAKALTFIGAGTNPITGTIIANNTGILFRGVGVGANLFRISSMRFNSSPVQGPVILLTGPSSSNRIDNCWFQGGDVAIASNFYTESATGPCFGVADHNTFVNMERPYFATDKRQGDSVWGTQAWTEPMLPGTGSEFYFEDNQFIWDAGSVGMNQQGAVYGQYAGGVCFRYNTMTGAGVYMDAHGDSPDFGCKLYEIYNNTFTEGSFASPGDGKISWQRGGSWIVHDNNYVTTELPMRMSVYFTSDVHRVTNTYVWNNTLNGVPVAQTSIAQVQDSGQTPPGYSAAHIVLGQQYFFAPPSAGQAFFPYATFTYPHPLVQMTTNAPPPDIPVVAYPTFHAGDGLIQGNFFASNHFLYKTDPAFGGLAQFRVVIPSNWTYTMRGNVLAEDTASNSVYLNWNADPSADEQKSWNVSPLTTGFQDRVVSWKGNGTSTPQFPTNVWALSAGTNTLYLAGREPGGWDTFTVEPVPAPTPPPPPPGVSHLAMDANGITAATTPGSTVTANVYRTGETNQVSTVDYYTLDGSALSNRNYTATTGTLTFGLGVTNTSFPITILADAVDRGSLNFTTVLRNPSANSDIVTPTNELVALFPPPAPPPPVPPPIAHLQFTQAGLFSSMVPNTLIAQLERMDYLATTSSVYYSTYSGTAKAGVNFVATNGLAVFNPGDTLFSIPIQIKGTSNYVGNLGFYLYLFSPSSGTAILSPTNLLIVLTPAAPRPATRLVNGTMKNGTVQ